MCCPTSPTTPIEAHLHSHPSPRGTQSILIDELDIMRPRSAFKEDSTPPFSPDQRTESERVSGSITVNQYEHYELGANPGLPCLSQSNSQSGLCQIPNDMDSVTWQPRKPAWLGAGWHCCTGHIDYVGNLMSTRSALPPRPAQPPLMDASTDVMVQTLPWA